MLKNPGPGSLEFGIECILTQPGYTVAFSTAQAVRRTAERRNSVSELSELPNNLVSPLFEAAMEASEEAIYNALLAAVTTDGYNGTIEALPLDRLTEIIGRSGRKKAGSE